MREDVYVAQAGRPCPALRRAWRPVAAVLALGLLCAGCAAFSVPEEPASPAPLAPVWDAAELRAHLRFVNAAELEGRATGTQGYARAAAYVAARMGEFRLQPVLEDEFRVLYGTPVHDVRSAVLLAAGADTVAFVPGLDYLPDGRSDSGRVQAATVLVVPGPEALPAVAGLVDGAAVAAPAGAVTTAWLEAMRGAGAVAVLVVGPLEPRRAPAPVPGLLVVHATPATAAALLGTSAAEAADRLGAREASLVVLPRRLHLRVAADHQAQAGAINVMGYVAGKHPAYRRELVVVCADLDALGSFGGVVAMDLDHFGRATAALLELARNFSHVARRWTVPDRTLLFAVWSGARTGHAGLRAYLRQPAWALAETRAVVYLGLRPADEPAVRALLAGAGVSLVAVPPPAEPLHAAPVVLAPGPAPGGRVSRVPAPDLGAVVARAVEQAREMAGAAYPVVLRESTGAETIPGPGAE